MPVVVSATVQTTARPPLLMARGPTASIAMAGSQYSVKTSHRLDRMSRDSQAVPSDFMPRTAASVRSRQFYNLECGPESSEIPGGSRAIRKLNHGEPDGPDVRLREALDKRPPRNGHLANLATTS